MCKTILEYIILFLSVFHSFNCLVKLYIGNLLFHILQVELLQIIGDLNFRYCTLIHNNLCGLVSFLL